jgi:tetratricopeptide (TPR) repeat protein
MFIALARLNEIDVPSRLPVGARLKVPEESGEKAGEKTAPGIDQRADAGLAVAETAGAGPDSAGAAVPETDVATETETVAEFLALTGRPDPARTMLRGLVERGEASKSGTRRFVELTLDAARAAMDAETFGVAVDLLSNAQQALGASVDEFPSIESLHARARAGVLMQQARAARERGETVEAYGLARRAATVAPAADPARQLAVALRQSLIDELHNEALIAWRDRDVDRAIRTWETLLQAVPDFEPAQVYLQRARRLRSRLDNP